jgi:glutamine amidotransferase
VETFNGDGFGLGWYTDASDSPGVYRSLMPAWGDHNLQSLAAHIVSPLFLAHVRATTGTPVQNTNCHPFRHENWLFVHNGAIANFHDLRRELVLAIDPSLYNVMEGSTDSETMFCLALTFGLHDDAITALERMAGFVEETAHRRGVEHPLQMTLGVSDGDRLIAVRYSSLGQSRTLFTSAEPQTLRHLYPDHELAQIIGDEDRAVVSEPLGDLPGVWTEVPEATVLILQDGPDEQRTFQPRSPALAGAAR